jgi:hypothetical protein
MSGFDYDALLKKAQKTSVEQAVSVAKLNDSGLFVLIAEQLVI